VHFDEPTVTLASFRAHLVETVANTGNVELFNFNLHMVLPNVRIDHYGNNYFALLANYDEKTDVLTMADTHPDRTFWQCSTKAMFAACCNKEEKLGYFRSCTRHRGLLRLSYASDIAKKRGFKYGPTVFGRRESYFPDKHFGIPNDLQTIELHEFQQPINCCNFTALAHGFCALGYLTTVDEIFRVTKTPIINVTNGGLTLAQTFDACVRFIYEKSLPFIAECVHFDPGSVSVEEFRLEMKKACHDLNDVHIFNFNVNMAHNRKGLGGMMYDV